MVPVIQSARGDTGRVNESNKANFVTPMMKMFPVADIDADIRPPYTYTGPELTSGGGNWTALLNELNTLRITRIVRERSTTASSGSATRPASPALGTSALRPRSGGIYQPSGAEIMAHEIGPQFRSAARTVWRPKRR